MYRVAIIPLLIICTVLLAACAPKQRIPVSTNPIGATIYADGRKVCTSPCAVRFDKRSDHLLTIVMEGYEQVDLEITRQFTPDEAIRDGILYGVLKGGDPEEVAKEVGKEVDEQERSGEAYDLVPSIVTVTLQPETD